MGWPLLALGWLVTLGLVPALQDAAPKEDAAPWVVDDDGLRQWKEPGWECARCAGTGETECVRCKKDRGPVCAECEEERVAPCRACGGEGEAYDPLEDTICPYCDGSALWECGNCFGQGNYKPTGSGKKGQKCGPCKGSGCLKCEACRGKGHVSVVKVGRNPGDAKAYQLEKARETLSDVLRVLENYRPSGDESNDRKTFELVLKDLRGVLPSIKDTNKLVEAGTKSLRVSAQYVGYERWVAKEFVRLRDGTIDLVQSQIALIDLCLRRLEFNDNVTGR